MGNLHTYLTENRIRQDDFAKLVGTTQGMVSRLVRGRIQPSLDLAVRIQRATKGEVSAASWIKEPSIPPSEEDAA
jgi:transcriptional regulator with XRE-family HTH domain